MKRRTFIKSTAAAAATAAIPAIGLASDGTKIHKLRYVKSFEDFCEQNFGFKPYPWQMEWIKYIESPGVVKVGVFPRQCGKSLITEAYMTWKSDSDEHLDFIRIDDAPLRAWDIPYHTLSNRTSIKDSHLRVLDARGPQLQELAKYEYPFLLRIWNENRSWWEVEGMMPDPYAYLATHTFNSMTTSYFSSAFLTDGDNAFPILESEHGPLKWNRRIFQPHVPHDKIIWTTTPSTKKWKFLNERVNEFFHASRGLNSTSVDGMPYKCKVERFDA